MSGPFGSSQWMYASGGFYNGVATQSLRFDPASNPSLTKTPSSASNRKTWTLSFWTKRCGLGGDKIVFNAGVTGTDEIDIFFPSDNFMVSDRSGKQIKTNAVYRDVSSWYHFVIVMDTTEATDTNRLKLYVNGVQETSFNSPVYPTLNQEFSVNNTKVHYVGTRSLGDNDYDGYLAEMNLIDGTALDPTSFGEFKNGVWIAKRYTGSYGTNGFRLQFNQTGTGTASSSTIGADTSGNDNHFSSSGIVASDCDMPDSPENNMCTFNSVGRRYGQSYVGTFSEGNLKVAPGGNATNVFGTMAINQIASQGGVYFEVRMDSLDTSRTYFGVVGDTGANNQNAYSNSGGYTFPIKGMINNDPRGYFTTDTDASNSVDLTANTAFSNGDVAGIAILSDGKFFCHRNGTYLQNADGNVGNPSTGANPIATIDLTLGDWVAYVGYNSSFSINFGQDGSFSGNETSGGYQDANGIGDFMFAVPTNCLAICTSNMAEPTISPNAGTQADEYFNTVLYTGNGGTQSITGFGFQPDFIWDKSRSNADSHSLVDSVRGVGKYLRTNLTSAEVIDASILTSFDSDGVTVGDINGNASGSSSVMWGWKAGGTAVSNTDGSITSSVSANTDAGFSIVSYTGTGSGATVGHGLGVVPQMFIVKSRDSAESWLVYHHKNTSAPETDALQLNLTSATVDTAGAWNDTAPTSTVFSVGSGNASNKSGDDFIAYVFAEIEGYSKFGSYTGNGSSDGTFVYTGFRPAFVMLKRSDGTSSWSIRDNTRNDENPADLELRADSSVAEYTESGGGVDLLSNGFKCRTTTGGNNASGGTYIYMAFAEQPFRYANAR